MVVNYLLPIFYMVSESNSRQISCAYLEKSAVSDKNEASSPPILSTEKAKERIGALLALERSKHSHKNGGPTVYDIYIYKII